MLNLVLALLAGVVTIAAPCTLPMLPILLGASVGQTSKARPVTIAAGFVLSFSLVALTLSAITRVFDFDPNVLRSAAAILLIGFGLLMLWPAPFEWLSSRLGGFTGAPRQGLLGGFVLGTTLGLVWTPCAGPVLGSILTVIATSKDTAWAGTLWWSTPSARRSRCWRSPMADRPRRRACAASRASRRGSSRALASS